MSEPAALSKVRSSIPGMYRVRRSEFPTYSEFNRAMAEVEAMAARRTWFFKKQSNPENEDPFDVFVVEIMDARER